MSQLCADPGALLPVREAAALAGISRDALVYHAKQGRLVRANPGGKGVPALYRAADVLAVRDTRTDAARRDGERRRREEALATGRKQCTRCLQTKPLEAFVRNIRGVAGRISRCRKCERQIKHERYQTDPAFRAARRAAWRGWLARHPERSREFRRAWRERNREQNNRRRREYDRQDRAVLCGKTSPIMRKTGFLLTLNLRDVVTWRAHRADVTVPAGEVALCRFEPSRFEAGRWVVEPVLVVPLAHRDRAARLVARLTRREEAGRHA